MDALVRRQWIRRRVVATVVLFAGVIVGTTPASAQPTIPGTIQAEDFDNGGPGISYYDTTPGNSGGQYRDTDVDIESSSEGGFDVGWIASGEWLNYTLYVPVAGAYTVQLHVSSPYGGALHVGFNGPSTGTWQPVSVPTTGGWQSWTTVTTSVRLQPGVQQLTLYFDTGGFNVDAIDILSSSGSSDSGSSGSGSSVTGLTVLTWNIDSVESWNGGPDHAVAVMDHIAQLSPRPDVIVLQEALLSQFNTYVSELEAQTGVGWSGVFATHCAPGGWNGSWCTDAQDEGVAVLTHFPVVDASTGLLPFPDEWHSGRAVARAAINVGTRVVQVFSAHMSNSPDARYQMMQALIGMTASASAPVLVGGDFNADPDQIDQGWAMGSTFTDAWQIVGSGPGYTADTPWPSMHLDYWFDDYSGFVQPAWANVDQSAGTVSDHFPVYVVYSVY
jgi:endonuclease/exonuclease/phosphatase family metal-dependent hydrolase